MKANPRIIVIGDVMLDIYRYGDVDRISPEAPVPVVHIKNSTKGLGGAGNTFANLCGLNSRSTLIGIVGTDRYGLVEIPAIFHEKYPKADYLFIKSSVHPTIVKERVIARTQQICRMDWENVDAPMPIEVQFKINELLRKETRDCDILLISDYAKGFINQNTMNTIHTLKEEQHFVIVLDPHPKNVPIYGNIDYATPNMKEYEEIGETKFWEMGCRAIIRTEGANGITIIQPGQGDIHLTTAAQQIFDVSGAGDTVSAVFSHMIAFKFGLVEAVTAANASAGVVVAKPGTAPIKRTEFDKIMRRI
jgi:D-beta-D-heptose 7-phosphate kinase/D-beta-D-heptose 1-phosphate adenosyltransferase